jgi:hypothetical protein
MDLRDEIATLAYELYISSGYINGRDEENWLEAERIILARQRLEQPEEHPAQKKQVKRSRGKNSQKDESNIA